MGVLNNTNEKAYTILRKELVENQKLEAIIFMPQGVFEPYSGVQTGILIFTKTNSGGTGKVWFYNMENDGFTLNKKRDPIDDNDIPDIVSRFHNLKEEAKRTRKDKSFLVDKDEIVKNDYVLSFNKYHEREIVQQEFRPVKDILKSITTLEKQFKDVMAELEKDI